MTKNATTHSFIKTTHLQMSAESEKMQLLSH